jgi:hypothetical protein
MALTNDGTLEVTYYVAPPKGGWASANNGTYQVYLQAGQIGDQTGNYAPSGMISGGFNVTIANAAQSVLPAAAPNSGSVTTPATGGGNSTGAPMAPAAAPVGPKAAPASSKPVCGPMQAPFADLADAQVETLDLLPSLPPLRLTMSLRR